MGCLLFLIPFSGAFREHRGHDRTMRVRIMSRKRLKVTLIGVGITRLDCEVGYDVGLRRAEVTRRLDSWRFLKIVHFQEGYESGSRDA